MKFNSLELMKPTVPTQEANSEHTNLINDNDLYFTITAVKIIKQVI